MELNSIKMRNGGGTHYDIEDPDQNRAGSYENPLDQSVIGLGSIIQKA